MSDPNQDPGISIADQMRQAANQIACAGHNGWGNTLRDGANEIDALRASIATAYGYLWHINDKQGMPVAMYPPERAAYEARKVLRDLLTAEQRGKGINEARASIDASRGKT